MKQIILVLMLFLCCSIEQQTQQFITGTYLDMEYTQDARVYPLLDSLNINTLMAHTPLNYQTLLQNYKLLAFKEDNAQDAIAYYARGYYKKWEASENQTNTLATGVKHNGGNQTTINDTSCWSSGTAAQKIDNLICGPTYRQDKFYRVFFNSPRKIGYIANYYLSVENHPGFDPSPGDTVCKIAVVFKYLKRIGNTSESYFSETLDSAYLKVSDFNGSYFNKKTLSYTYPSYITSLRGKDLMREMMSVQDISYIDDIPETGIEFRVDWLGAKKLNVYGVEVYDDVIWEQFIEDPVQVTEDIVSFSNRYSSWNNIKYWYVHDEPQSLDLYEPYKVIDNILNANSKPGVITTFYPQWDGRRNGDITLNKFKSLANPQKILMDYYPYWKDTATPAGLERLRQRLQEISLQDTSFWYTAQAFGDTSECNPNVGSWRTPSAEDLKASVMLSLAHGAKGVLYWKFIDFLPANTTCDTFFTTIVDAQFNKHALWYPVKEINNRLKNVLGNTLVNLNYTGNYINVTQDSVLPKTNNFLTIQQYDADYNWHIGFLNDKTYQDNKHFLLVNLRTAANKTAKLLITNNSGYNNLRIRNIEDQSLDITINTSYTLYQTLQAGEGKLYQVAPVVKHGGTLINNEAISGTNDLTSPMTIASGATLTISGIYNIYGNITLNSGGNLYLTQGAKLNFFNGSSLIVNGLLFSNGTTTNKVTFDFITKSYTAQNGIKVNTGASLYVSNSIIKNGWYGIYCNNSYTSSIYNWEITGCYYGIYFNNTNIGISNNYIHANNMGIALYNSSPVLTQNKIADNSNYGVSSSGSTSIPKFGSSGTQGKNKITGNGVGVCAFSNSLPMLGNNSPLNGGYNTFGENTIYNVYAITSGIMFAINNYWGNTFPAPPTATKIWIYNGVILYSPYLSSDPTGLNKTAPLAEDAELVLLKKAMDLIDQNEFIAAREICLEIIDNYSDSYAAFNALSLLTQTYNLDEKETTKLKFKTLFNKDKKKLNAVAGLILAELDKENKLKNIDEVISKHKGDAIIEDALFAKFLYYYNDIQDKENARLVSNELDKLFPNSVSSIDAHRHLGDKDYLQKEYSFAKTNQEQKQNIVVSPIPEEYNLFANYPNPFNPITVIKYALPYASNVNITVYNTLGQIVKEYYEGTKEAGYYSVNFTGENLSSGVYLYSINAVSANGKQNFNATKKMLLLK